MPGLHLIPHPPLAGPSSRRLRACVCLQPACTHRQETLQQAQWRMWLGAGAALHLHRPVLAAPRHTPPARPHAPGMRTPLNVCDCVYMNPAVRDGIKGVALQKASGGRQRVHHGRSSKLPRGAACSPAPTPAPHTRTHCRAPCCQPSPARATRLCRAPCMPHASTAAHAHPPTCGMTCHVSVRLTCVPLRLLLGWMNEYLVLWFLRRTCALACVAARGVGGAERCERGGVGRHSAARARVPVWGASSFGAHLVLDDDVPQHDLVHRGV